MSAKAAPEAFRQSWRVTVSYIGNDDVHREMSCKFICNRVDIVSAYMERKFKRMAKATKWVRVEDNGMVSNDSLLELTRNSDGSITAHKGDGIEIATETVTGSYVYHTQPYVPPPPKPVYPSLAQYASAFDKVVFPLSLYDTPQSHKNRFKAKFYEVFPREEK